MNQKGRKIISLLTISRDNYTDTYKSIEGFKKEYDENNSKQYIWFVSKILGFDAGCICMALWLLKVQCWIIDVLFICRYANGVFYIDPHFLIQQ